MASQQSQKGLLEELSKHRIEASKLKNSLNELDREKESWFKKREEFSKKIRESIQNIKSDKARRDALTQEVKGLKTKRDAANNEINEKLKEFGKLKTEKTALIKSLGIKESPSKTRQKIEKLEFMIQTEAMPFEKEQSLMKRIKELKNLYEHSKVVDEVDKKIKEVSGAMAKMREEANEMHKLLQEKAKQSQALHEGILRISAEIDKMKIEEEGTFRTFSEFKKRFNEANAQLKEKLKAMNDVKSALDKISYDRKERRKQEVESFLKSKEEEVNQKIKRGEKLTTEDLLVFQKFDRE